MGDFNSLKYGNGKEFEKTELGIPGGRGKIQLKKRKQKLFRH